MTKLLKRNKALTFIALAFVASANLNAQTWTGATDTDFGTATNWDTNVLPASGVAITIPATINSPVVATTTTLTSGALSINAGASLNIKGSLTASAISYTGGTLVIDGGTLNVRSNFYLGVTNNPSTVTVNSGTLNAKTNLIVGERGACTMEIKGGTVSVDQGTNGVAIIIGGYYSAGTVNLKGGVLKTNLTKVGTAALAITENPKSAGGVGSLYIDGGTLMLGGDQTAFVAGYVTANKIVTASGKSIVATYDGTNTNVTAVATNPNLGTDTFEKADIVTAYPNPTTDTVTVSLPNGVAVEKIAVYNNVGQLVLTEAKNTVSLQQLNNGIYFLTIYTAEGNFSKKIIKK